MRDRIGLRAECGGVIFVIVAKKRESSQKKRLFWRENDYGERDDEG